MSLSFEWCKCDDYGSIFKHLSTLKMIFDEELPYLLNFFFNICESNGFMDPLHANESWDDLNKGQN